MREAKKKVFEDQSNKKKWFFFHSKLSDWVSNILMGDVDVIFYVNKIW
jgi:hypothetical protein